ncbi:hypothetical protein [Dissulfuribacter thermophilus]|nr:hypothetical protein [Dissulfuribacter thermophilus]
MESKKILRQIGYTIFIIFVAYGICCADSSCIECHKGIEPIIDTPPMKDLPCEFCHQGDPKEIDMKMAHDGLLSNPSDYRVVDRTCGVCHYDIVLSSKKSLHATSAGIISGARWAWGAQNTKRAIYGTYNVRDTDKDIPSEHGALTNLNKLPRFNPKRPLTNRNHPVDDYLRAECLRCHVWSRGEERPGDYRASGCAACHVLYSDQGLYEGNDQAISKDRPGRPITHRITSKIPTFQCLHCHNRGDRIGTNFIGTMESDGYGAPWSRTAGAKGGKKLHGKYYNYLIPDIHYERGMACIDCHTQNDIHGDGNIYSKKEQAVEIECTDCHGTLTQKSTLYSSRGKRIPWIWEDKGKILLQGKIDGKIHVIPQIKEILNSNNDMAKTAMGIPGHLEKLECYACHAKWAPQCYGCHVQQDLSQKAKDWIESKRSADLSKAGERGYLAQSAFKWRETRSYLRWDDPTLGINSEGLVAPFIPGCQVIFTQIGPGSNSKFTNYVFTTSEGISGISSNPLQPHTIRKEARGCESCHSNKKALGLGTGTFIPQKNGIPIPFGLDQIVDENGTQLQSTSHDGARPFNREEMSKINRMGVCADCHKFMTDPVIWKRIKKRVGSAQTRKLHTKVLKHLIISDENN